MITWYKVLPKGALVKMSIEPTGIEKTFGDDDIIVSKTDTKGVITYGNELFIQMSGYTEEELLGAPHNIIRHPKMPRAVFKLLWDTVANREEIFAYVINLAKDGSHYWVLANVTPSYNLENEVIAYHSVRRKPSKEAVATVEGLYEKMLVAEKSGGVDAGVKLLLDILEKEGLSYEEFILSL